MGKTRATAMMMLGNGPMPNGRSNGDDYQVVDDADLLTTAQALAARLADGPKIAYNLMLEGVVDCRELNLTDELALERRNQKTAGLAADHEEGVAAFLDKRKPVFTGK